VLFPRLPAACCLRLPPPHAGIYIAAGTGCWRCCGDWTVEQAATVPDTAGRLAAAGTGGRTSSPTGALYCTRLSADERWAPGLHTAEGGRGTSHWAAGGAYLPVRCLRALLPRIYTAWHYLAMPHATCTLPDPAYRLARYGRFIRDNATPA